MRILIIEDELTLADLIATRLKEEHYLVDVVTEGEEGLYYATSNIYDLILLDVMLPKISGFEILKKIREDKINSKIIMLTAKSMLEDKLEGLQNGANDYVTKPFHMDELVARVNVQLKTISDFNQDLLIYQDLELSISKSRLTCKSTKETVDLVRKEYQLLEYFMNNPEQILSKEQIYDKIWGIENEIESNNLEVYLSFLRRKIKAIGSCVNIKSMRGMGYRMEYHHESFEK